MTAPALTPKRAQGLRRFETAHYAASVDGAPPAIEARHDWLVVEEPLEIRIAGERWLTTMRTPGHDRELVLGLLLAEGVIRRAADVSAIAHCGRPTDEGFGNVVEVTPAPPLSLDFDLVERASRGMPVTSACGVCGRQSIADLLTRCRPLDQSVRITAADVAGLTDKLFQEQTNFHLSGGVHAAMLVNLRGEPWAAFEDVGRHNAVDKVLGHWLRVHDAPASEQILVVSGRTSFEIVTKAVMSRCTAVVGVSAPSSLAVETAERLGLLLVGFARDQSYNVYAGEQRLVR